MEDEGKKMINIDRHMLPSKSSFFFSYVLFAIRPYYNVFLTSIGLSASQAGLITGIRTIASFIAGPLWSAFSDFTGRRTLIMVLLWSGFLVTTFPLPWIAQIIDGNDIIINITGTAKVKCNGLLLNKTFQNISLINTTFRPGLSNVSIFQNNDRNEQHGSNTLFLVMFALFTASAVFELPMFGYQDALIMNVVKNNKQKTTFGFQRLFGSFGIAAGIFAYGLAADNYQLANMSSYTAIFICFLPMSVMYLPFIIAVVQQGKWCEKEKCQKEIDPEKKGQHEDEKAKNADTDHPKSICRVVFDTCSNLKTFIFLLSVFVVGLGNMTYQGFTFMYMEDEMEGTTKTIMALNVIVACSAEMPVFAFSEKLIRFFGGPMVCVIIAVFSYFVRYMLISFIENPWLTLPVQSLHSLGYALFWVASLEYLNTISPSNVKATMISLLTAIHYSLSTVIANAVGGIYYEKLGGRTFFRVVAFICLAWTVVLLLFFFGLRMANRFKPGKEDTNKDTVIKNNNALPPSTHAVTTFT